MNSLLGALRKIESRRESDPARPVTPSPNAVAPTVLAPPKAEPPAPAPAPPIVTVVRADIEQELLRSRSRTSNDAAARALVELLPRGGRLVFVCCRSVTGPARIVADLAEGMKLLGRAPIEVLGAGAYRLRSVCGDPVFATSGDEFIHAEFEQWRAEPEMFRRCDAAMLVVDHATPPDEAARAADALRRSSVPLLGALFVE